MTTAQRALDLTIDVLATKRLTRLVVDDVITEPLRDRFFQRFGGPETNKFSYLITCPHCTSIYIAAGITLARMIAPRLWSPVAYGLSLSAVTSLIAERE